MTDITISYAIPDQDRVSTIVEALRREGYAVWWDRDLPSGAERKAAIAEQMAAAKLCLIAWSQESVDAPDVIDEAERAKGRRAYLGVLLDKAELPFGFGGLAPVDVAPFRGSGTDLAAIVAGVREFMATGQARVEALEALAPPPPPGPNKALIFGIAGGAALLVAAILFFVMRGSAPSVGEVVESKLAATPCAWLRIDPVVDGSDGRLGLVGVAGDPAAARQAVLQIIGENGLPISDVLIERVARIDPRECPSIDEPRKLRKSPGGRLMVTGDPFILDTAMTPAQALARVEIQLQPEDRTVALFGVEPSGVVTWASPDMAALDALKDMDVGLKKVGDRRWEFNIYSDHVGWTGLFVIVGNRPLAQTRPQGTVQSAADFAATLRAATAQGDWDADMVWYRIDPKR